MPRLSAVGISGLQAGEDVNRLLSADWAMDIELAARPKPPYLATFTNAWISSKIMVD